MRTLISALLFVVVVQVGGAFGQVPRLIQYQGRIVVESVNFTGNGQFRFAIVNGDGSNTYWTNSPDVSPADGRPDTAVTLNVQKGLYSVLLGDVSLPNMASLPAGAFDHPDVRLRVWFDDGVHGVQLLAPDQRFASVSYALMAGDIPDGTVTGAKLAGGAVTGSHIANGAINSVHFAPGAIPAGNVGPGSVGTAELANGAVDFTKLAKPPQSGSLDASALPLGEAIPFSVIFPQAYQVAPIVTASLAARSAAPLTGLAVSVGSITPTGFEGLIQKLASDRGTVVGTTYNGNTEPFPVSLTGVNGKAVMAFHWPTSGVGVALAQTGTATSWQSGPFLSPNASHPSMADIGGREALSLQLEGKLCFFRASNSSNSWPPAPVEVASGGVYQETRLLTVSGKPAITYVGAGLHYVRAADAEGTAWGSPVAIDASSNGRSPSFAIVAGNPAISYIDSTTLQLKFVRATNPEGSQWGVPVVVSATGSHSYSSLKEVDGRPAICYYNGASLKYVRAGDATGTSWPAATIVDPENGEYPSLDIVDGRPAIAYQDLLRKDLRFVQASNASGSAWKTPLTLDSTGDVGAFATFANVNGSAVIACHSATDMAVKVYRPIIDYRVNWIALPE